MVRTACRELSTPLAGFEPVTICLQHRSKMPRELRGGISDKIAVSDSNLPLRWAMLGSLGLSWGSLRTILSLSWRLLKAVVGHLETILGLCWAAWDSLGALLAASEGYGIGHLETILRLCWAA